MEETDKTKITGSLTTLISDLCIDDVMPYLIENSVMTLSNEEDIEVEKTQQKRVMKFIKILVTKGPFAYNQFCNSLNLTGQSHLVAAMENSTKPSRLKLSEEDDETNQVLSALQEELRCHYERTLRQISPIPWSNAAHLHIDQVFTALQIVRGVNRSAFQPVVAQRQQENLIGMEDLFSPHSECASPKKVLVEGEPGMGKSTLCCKLAYDWSVNSNDNFMMKKFTIILFFKARDLCSNQTLSEAVKSHLLPDDFDYPEEDIRKCLKLNQEKILIIIDGYDEINGECSITHRIIEGKLLSKSSVLVTSRNGHMIPFLKYFDTVLQNIGYSSKQRIHFIEKFIGTINNDSVAENLLEDFKLKLQTDGLLKDVGRNPLNLSILCLLLCEFNILPKSVTEIYMAMHSFILSRTKGRVGATEDEFVVKCEPVYKVAYEGLVQGLYQMTDTELEKHCDVDFLERLCFFNKEISISRFTQQVHYSFVHKSFQEFFAAKFIAGQTDLNKLTSMIKRILQFQDCHIVAVFVCGLLKEDPEKINHVLLQIADDSYIPHDAEIHIGVQYVIENHRSHLLFRCLAEIAEIEFGSFQEMLVKTEVGNVCFSIPYCQDGCVQGLIEYLKILDTYCKCDVKYRHKNGLEVCRNTVKVSIQMMCLDSRTVLYEHLIQNIGSSKHGRWLEVMQISTTDQLMTLFKTLSKFAGLQSLDLQFLNIGSTENVYNLKSIKNTLLWLKNLRLVECQNSALLAEILGQIPEHNQLNYLEIKDSYVEEDCAKVFYDAIGKFTKLSVLIFYRNVIHVNEATFYTTMLHKLASCPLQGLWLTELPSLRMAERKGSIMPINEGSASFASPEVSHLLHHCHITHLSISKSYLGEVLLRMLAKALLETRERLQFLELKSNNITSADALDELLLVVGQLPNLTCLNLDGSELNESNVSLIVDIMKTSTQLESLSIPCKAGSIQILASGLAQNSSLLELHLAHLRFPSLDNEVGSLAAAIRKHPRLQKLNFRSNRAPPRDLELLIDAATENSSIHTIKLSNFGMTVSHLLQLAKKVGQNSHISVLDLKGNDINESVASALHEALENRPKLKFLNVSQSVLREAHSAVQRLRERVVLLKVDWF